VLKIAFIKEVRDSFRLSSLRQAHELSNVLYNSVGALECVTEYEPFAEHDDPAHELVYRGAECKVSIRFHHESGFSYTVHPL